MTARLSRWRARTDGPLVALAVGSLPLLLLELKRDQLAHADRVFVDIVNVVVLVAFAADYAVELSLCRHRRRYVRSEWASAVIVGSQALAVVPGLGGFGVLRALRGARALRAIAVVLRLFAVGGATARHGRRILRQNAARFALSLAGFTWVASASCFTLAESVGAEGRIHSFGDALWWSAATITTVGYGDVFPITAVGRIIGIFTMLVGISTFAIVTAKVAEFLVRTDHDPDPTPS